MSTRKTRSDVGKPRGPRVPKHMEYLKWYASLPADERTAIRDDMEWLEELRGLLPEPVTDPTQNAALRDE